LFLQQPAAPLLVPSLQPVFPTVSNSGNKTQKWQQINFSGRKLFSWIFVKKNLSYLSLGEVRVCCRSFFLGLKQVSRVGNTACNTCC
jgi:hypothetical protein